MPSRNPHRTGTEWTLGTVTTILSNPRYTGRQVWNRQRTDKDLPRLPALHLLLTEPAGGTRRRRTRCGTDVRYQATAEAAITYLGEYQITVIFAPAPSTLQAGTGEAATTITLKAS